MGVFISYDREHGAVAQLLAYILTSKGIECDVDRQLPVGERFDDNIKKLIRKANLVLVLVTKASETSPWVNQEVGFAIACEKRVWPVVMESDVQPKGMLSTSQSYPLFDWANAATTVDKLIAAIGSSEDTEVAPFDMVGLGHVIRGKIGRSKFFIKKFKELVTQEDRQLQIFLQAGFGIITASNDSLVRESGHFSNEELELLMEERGLFDQLAAEENVELKLILWPERAYERKYLEMRFKRLLEWLRKHRNTPGVSFACAKYTGATRIIVPGRYYVDGYKQGHTAGYDMTVVNYEAENVDKVKNDFLTVFRNSYVNNDNTIQLIRSMYEQSCPPAGPLESSTN